MSTSLRFVGVIVATTYWLSLYATSSARLCAAEQPRSFRKPNILLILADDLHWRDLGCTGNPDVHTPHIDRLARQSTRLARMYSSAATCSPARHALYTGLFPVRSGAYPNHTMVDPGTRSLFTYLNEAGYRVGLHGKSHVHPPESFPYEVISKDPDDFPSLRRFITRDDEQPWLAVFASHDPHTPWSRGPAGRYDPRSLGIPPWLHDNPETRTALCRYYGEVTRLDAQVGRCLEILSRTGQEQNTIVLFLSEQGSAFPYGGKWTLYDNGIHIAAFIRWPGHFEAGRVAKAIVQYVDITPTLLDIVGVDWRSVDTGCADANGLRNFDGRSFLAVLEGKRDEHRQYAFAQNTTVGVNGYRQPYPSRAVVGHRYKLIWNLAPQNIFWINGIHGNAIYRSWKRDAKHDDRVAKRVDWLSNRPEFELYDLQRDPFEFINLVDDAHVQTIRQRLLHELQLWMKQQGDQGLETEQRATERQPRRRGRRPDRAVAP